MILENEAIFEAFTCQLVYYVGSGGGTRTLVKPMHTYINEEITSAYINWNTSAYSGQFLFPHHMNGVFIGTGTDKPQVTDYNLTIPFTDFTDATTTFTYKVVNNHFAISVWFNALATQDATITEIGFYKDILVNSSGTSKRCLFTHDLLDEPITVKANEPISITYTIEFS